MFTFRSSIGGRPTRWRWLRRLVSLVAGLAVLAGAGLWFVLRASLPRLDGEVRLDGLTSRVRVERDALGVPTVRAGHALDAVRALGFLHAQERFFQMDLLRRKSAGELAEILGPAALDADRDARMHRFRARAEAVEEMLPPAARARLAAYAAGVNAGLGALDASPWEYHVLRAKPAPWREADSLLVLYSMWLDLQDEQGRFERTINALRASGDGEIFTALAPAGDVHDAPLDGSDAAPVALPRPLRGGSGTRGAGDREPVPGSNAFAVAGRHTAHGAALLASDMHLGLAVPNVWYRAVLYYPDGHGSGLRMVGVTLPGVPDVIAGSNERIAWGFTNAYIDTVDVVPVETDAAGENYRTAEGWKPLDVHAETLRVKGREPEAFSVRWTCWGPLIEEPRGGRALAVAWNAHDPTALNLEGMALSEAGDVDEAVAIMHRAGMPNQNVIVADSAGRIAWTVAGRIPVRSPGFDGLRAGDWAGGASGWAGWLAHGDVPAIVDPADGLLWSANQRHVGGESLRRLGDNGYDHGYRAGAIRDALRNLVAQGAVIAPRDLLAIQLDDHLRHLEPWRDLLVAALEHSDDPVKRDVGELARLWTGRAEPDSAGYRLVRAFREQATERILAPYLAGARRNYRRFNAGKLHTEELVLRLLRERRPEQLDPRFKNWEALMDEAVAAVISEVAKTGRPPRDYTWGGVNTLAMRHPLSRFLPEAITSWLDMPAVPLPGDADSPRNQTPRHGAAQRLVVAPGHEEDGIFHMPGGQSGHPLSPYYRAGHESWVRGDPTPLLPGPVRHVLELRPGQGVASND